VASLGGAPLALAAGGLIALLAAVGGLLRLPRGSRLEVLPGSGWRNSGGRRSAIGDPSLGRSTLTRPLLGRRGRNGR
jgi:hypothetical protein